MLCYHAACDDDDCGKNSAVVCFFQGPTETRKLPLPTELVFRVDDKILQAVDDAVALHKKNVSLFCNLFTFNVACVCTSTLV